MKTILYIHGPNHNILGKRDPRFYGTMTLQDIENDVDTLAAELGVKTLHFQTNYEGAMVERIQKAALEEKVDAICINPSSFTHYSIALVDALELCECPIYELHISNTMKREDYRQRSVVSPLAEGILIGLGRDVYTLALRAAVSKLNAEK
ncbi:MAG: 3-dehydroquinate dehydratase [Lachnospiraceae bacterium]|nr:3-dehydroquinate dehydratase [Lachnospiraceae bacterium]